MIQKPIESQQEADEIRNYLAKQVMEVHNVSLGQALRRIDAFNSVQGEIVKKFNLKDSDQVYHIIVDIAMMIPQQ